MKETQKKRNQAGLFLPNREVSWVIAAALFLCFSMFTLGYFWGQRRVVSSFLGKMEEESFADKITYSLYAMNGRDTIEEDTDDESASDETDEENIQDTSLNKTIESLPCDPIPVKSLKIVENNNGKIVSKNTIPNIPNKSEKVVLNNSTDQKSSEKIYVAPIVGFGTLHAAQSFAQRVKRSGIDVIIKDRKSTTPKGKKITWYQAVSHEYENKSDLQEMLTLLQKKENIKEITIIEKKKG